MAFPGESWIRFVTRNLVLNEQLAYLKLVKYQDQPMMYGDREQFPDDWLGIGGPFRPFEWTWKNPFRKIAACFAQHFGSQPFSYRLYLWSTSAQRRETSRPHCGEPARREKDSRLIANMSIYVLHWTVFLIANLAWQIIPKHEVPVQASNSFVSCGDPPHWGNAVRQCVAFCRILSDSRSVWNINVRLLPAWFSVESTVYLHFCWQCVYCLLNEICQLFGVISCFFAVECPQIASIFVGYHDILQVMYHVFACFCCFQVPNHVVTFIFNYHPKSFMVNIISSQIRTIAD